LRQSLFIYKNHLIMKNAFNYSREIMLSVSLLLASFVIMSGSCDKDDNNTSTDVYTITANASGANEFPANAATATGGLTGNYNKATNKLTYNLTWTGLTGTAAALHFHGPALPGANASPIVTLTITTPAATGGATGEVTITEAQEADMLAGKWYWNVHTATYPGGEIRGQVLATQ
jgi:CHRD domain